MIRPDGSVRSKNNPVWQNRAEPRDYGMYIGIVISRKIPLLNISSTTNAENTYNVRLLGGDRDGQLIFDCRVARSMGGHQNYSDITLQPATDPTFIPFGSQFNFTQFLGQENGDYVYLQFLGGDTALPVITGFAKHPLDPNGEVATLPPLGQQKIEQFNGVRTEIDPNGNFTWQKGLGTYIPLAPNLSTEQLGFPAFLINEYSPVPASEEFFKFDVQGLVLGVPVQTATFSTLTGMEVGLSVLTDAINISTATQTAISLDGLTGSISIANLLGTGIEVAGATDTITLGTAVGTGIEVAGLTDAISMTTAAGAAVSISGLTDTISVSTIAGGGMEISPTGVSIQNSAGGILDLPLAGLTLTDATGAGLEVSPAGFIKLGNAAADLVDIVDQALTALSTQTAPGFGAPTSTVATFLQLAAQIKLIKGG